MNRSWWYRFSFLIVVIAISVITIIPTVFNLDTEKSSFPVKSKINLGLDLQGGLYMVLGIDFNKVYADEVKNYAKKLETALKDEEIDLTLGELKVEDVEDPHHTVIVKDPSQVQVAKDYIKKFYSYPLRLTLSLIHI